MLHWNFVMRPQMAKNTPSAAQVRDLFSKFVAAKRHRWRMKTNRKEFEWEMIAHHQSQPDTEAQLKKTYAQLARTDAQLALNAFHLAEKMSRTS